MTSVKAICLLVFALIFYRLSANAQDFGPPKPLENKVFEAMIGDWTAESNMMGMPMKEEVSIKWTLNHQFISMELKATAKDNPKITYGGYGLFGVDDKGNLKGWWFDDWGAVAVSTGSGTFGENKMTMNDGNEMFKETRVFEIKNGDIIMSSKGTMTMNGKEMPFDETSTYKKK